MLRLTTVRRRLPVIASSIDHKQAIFSQDIAWGYAAKSSVMLDPFRPQVAACLRLADRPECTQVCDWWSAGGKGVLALVGIGGTGKTAIADRLVRSLPDLTEAKPHLQQDSTLLVPRMGLLCYKKSGEGIQGVAFGALVSTGGTPRTGRATAQCGAVHARKGFTSCLQNCSEDTWERVTR